MLIACACRVLIPSGTYYKWLIIANLCVGLTGFGLWSASLVAKQMHTRFVFSGHSLPTAEHALAVRERKQMYGAAEVPWLARPSRYVAR